MRRYWPKLSTWVVGAAIAAAVPLFEALQYWDPEVIIDHRVWLTGVVAASVRQVAIFMLAQIGAYRARALR